MMTTTTATAADGGLNAVTCSEAIFRAHRDRIYRQTDRMFARLMALQWIAGVVAVRDPAPAQRFQQALFAAAVGHREARKAVAEVG